MGDPVTHLATSYCQDSIVNLPCQSMWQHFLYTVGVQTFGQWLTYRLNKRELTARRAASLFGVSHTTVDNWVRGTTRPRRKHVAEIARVLEVEETEVWQALSELPEDRDDVTLARMLDLPRDVTEDELLLLRHLFRAVRAYTRELESRESGARRRAKSVGNE